MLKFAWSLKPIGLGRWERRKYQRKLIFLAKMKNLGSTRWVKDSGFLRHTDLMVLTEQLILLGISPTLSTFTCIILFNFQNGFVRIRSYQFYR